MVSICQAVVDFHWRRQVANLGLSLETVKGRG